MPNNTNELIKSRLEEYFKAEQANASETFNQLSLFIFNLEDSSSDLYKLARLLPEEQLYKIIEYFDGTVLKIPTKDKYKEALLLALVFYFYEVKHLSWGNIKSILHMETDFKDYSSISLGKKIIKIRNALNKELKSLLMNLDLDSVIETVKKQGLGSKG